PAAEQHENGADPGEVAREFVEEVLRAMDMEAEVRARRADDGAYRVEMNGPDMGLLIGRQGSSLGALQYLVTRVVSKRVGQRVRLVLDAEGYRSRREDALRET